MSDSTVIACPAGFFQNDLVTPVVIGDLEAAVTNAQANVSAATASATTATAQAAVATTQATNAANSATAAAASATAAASSLAGMGADVTASATNATNAATSASAAAGSAAAASNSVTEAAASASAAAGSASAAAVSAAALAATGGVTASNPITGFALTVPGSISTMILAPSGTLATGTVTMPAAPANGQMVAILTSQTITAFSVLANSGQTLLNSPTTLTAGAAVEWIYYTATAQWYRLQ